MINDKQCIILFGMDDLKISHVDSKMVDDDITMLEREIEKEALLTVTRGKVHEYLGMRLDFSNPGKRIVSLEPYIMYILEEMP
jgi:hypothetical protein